MAPLVDIVDNGGFGELSARIQSSLLKALQFLEKDECLVEVSLLDDREMARVNKEVRGKEGSTTVLSFEEPEIIPRPEEELPKLGEIYLAPNTIREKGMDPVRVAIHGLLHLLGYTHKAESDTIRMEKIEDKIWQTLSQD